MTPLLASVSSCFLHAAEFGKFAFKLGEIADLTEFFIAGEDRLLLAGHLDQPVVALDRVDLPVELNQLGLKVGILSLNAAEDVLEPRSLRLEELKLLLIRGETILITGPKAPMRTASL